MIIETNKSVFGTDADCIVNTINCVGFMGKGLALEFALRYPELENDYKQMCSKKEIVTGKVYFHNVNGQKIINFPTKFHFKYPSKIEWIASGLKDFKNNYKKWGIESVAFPILGGSNGGLDHASVLKLINDYLKDIDIPVYICHATEIDEQDKEMLKNLRSLNESKLVEDLRLTNKQIASLHIGLANAKRFADIRELDGIGNDTYKKIYSYIKEKKYEDSISLF